MYSQYEITNSPFEASYGSLSRLIEHENFDVNETYYWQVAGIAENDVGGWGVYGPSPAWEFTISSSWLTHPEYNTDINTSLIDFLWFDFNANEYQLIVDNDPTFTSPEVSWQHLLFNDINNNSYQLIGNWLSEGTYYWKVIAHFENDETLTSDVSMFNYEPTRLSSPDWRPLFRAFHNIDIDHFYCSAPNHLEQAKDSLYTFEGTEGFISLNPFEAPDMVNIFRMYKGTENGYDSEKRHYYTTSVTDRDEKISQNWIYEGITGYSFSSEHSGLTKLYYLEKDVNNIKDNFYTASEFEKDNAVNNFGYIYHNVLCYVSINAWTPISWFAMNPSLGNGINPQNGNFSYSKTSFSIPGAKLSLDFSHSYNSYTTNFYTPVNSIGKGWNHTYSIYILETDSDIFIFWPNGNIHVFD
jgi:hypothetical protein